MVVSPEVFDSGESWSKADLVHEVLVIPEQPFVIHRFSFPVPDRGHAERESLSRRRNRLAVSSGHWPGECAGHHTGSCCPRPGTEADRMDLDLDVGGEDEESFQILDVLVDALRLVTVGPGHDDVLGMTLTEPVPLLVAEYVEIEGIEDLEVFLDSGGLTLRRRRGSCRMLGHRLCENWPAETANHN